MHIQKAVGLIKKIREFAEEKGWNKHEIDMLDETKELLESNLTEAQKQKELERVGALLEDKMKMKKEKITVSDELEKEDFIKRIQNQLMNCWERSSRICKQRALEAGPEIVLLKDEIQSACDAGSNYEEMKHRQNFAKIIMTKVDHFNMRFRDRADSFAQDLIEEYDRCFNQLKRQFLNTGIAEFKKSEKEWYQGGDKNIDILHSDIKATAKYFRLDQAPFDKFAQECSVVAEKTAAKQKKFTDFLRLLPIIVYLVKYIIDTYLLQRQSFIEKILDMLMEKMMENGEFSVDSVLKVLEFAAPLLKESSKLVSFGLDMLFALILFGWLYFIYILIINRIRKKSLITKLQASVEVQVNTFLNGIDLQRMVEEALLDLGNNIRKMYLDNYRFLNQSLDSSKGSSDEAESEKDGKYLSALFKEYEQLI